MQSRIPSSWVICLNHDIYRIMNGHWVKRGLMPIYMTWTSAVQWRRVRTGPWTDVLLSSPRTELGHAGWWRSIVVCVGCRWMLLVVLDISTGEMETDKTVCALQKATWYAEAKQQVGTRPTGRRRRCDNGDAESGKRTAQRGNHVHERRGGGVLHVLRLGGVCALACPRRRWPTTVVDVVHGVVTGAPGRG
jgi:hypothetical protein